MTADAKVMEGLGGYTRVAKAINMRFRQDARPYDRRQIETWYRRGTRNAAGVRFPDSQLILPGAKPRTERELFDIRLVLAWAAAGVPRPHGDGFWTLAERQEHYAADGAPPAPGAEPAAAVARKLARKAS
jgi:hypothetical protein